jgi:hypothetical protein
MPLGKAKSRIPTAIGDLSIVLTDFIDADGPHGPIPAHQEGRYEVQVLNGDDVVMRVAQGNLVPHLGDSPITVQQLVAWLNWLRTKAEQEILP